MDPATGAFRLWDTDLNLAHLLAELLVLTEDQNGAPVRDDSELMRDDLYRDFVKLGGRKRLKWSRIVRGRKPGYLVRLVKENKQVFYPCSGARETDLVVKLEPWRGRWR